MIKPISINVSNTSSFTAIFIGNYMGETVTFTLEHTNGKTSIYNSHFLAWGVPQALPVMTALLECHSIKQINKALKNNGHYQDMLRLVRIAALS